VIELSGKIKKSKAISAQAESFI